MLAFPVQGPVALHLLGSGASVAGGSVDGRLVGEGKRVGGTLPSLFVIVTSAQLTNVSCFAFPPKPQSLSVQPQLFPVLHHHRSTQRAQVKPAGSLSLILNTSLTVSSVVYSEKQTSVLLLTKHCTRHFVCKICFDYPTLVSCSGQMT